MVIFKKAFPRRTFLRGVGATLALPMLDAMTPAFGAPAARPPPVPGRPGAPPRGAGERPAAAPTRWPRRAGGWGRPARRIEHPVCHRAPLP